MTFPFGDFAYFQGLNIGILTYKSCMDTAYVREKPISKIARNNVQYLEILGEPWDVSRHCKVAKSGWRFGSRVQPGGCRWAAVLCYPHRTPAVTVCLNRTAPVKKSKYLLRRCFGYGFRIQTPSQEVFGCLGCEINPFKITNARVHMYGLQNRWWVPSYRFFGGQGMVENL